MIVAGTVAAGSPRSLTLLFAAALVVCACLAPAGCGPGTAGPSPSAPAPLSTPGTPARELADNDTYRALRDQLAIVTCGMARGWPVMERANRTHTEGFYECSSADPTVAALGAELRAWETVYNTVRPHQALGYPTPAEYLDRWRQDHGDSDPVAAAVYRDVAPSGIGGSEGLTPVTGRGSRPEAVLREPVAEALPSHLAVPGGRAVLAGPEGGVPARESGRVHPRPGDPFLRRHAGGRPGPYGPRSR